MPAIHRASSAIAARFRSAGFRSVRAKSTRKLKRSPVMKPVDEQPVWSIVCFVVPSEYRGQGVAQALLKGAVAYAKKQGATLVEAYPVDKPARSKDDYMWFGAKSMYDKAGFKEVARRKPQRPIVRIRPR